LHDALPIANKSCKRREKTAARMTNSRSIKLANFPYNRSLYIGFAFSFSFFFQQASPDNLGTFWKSVCPMIQNHIPDNGHNRKTSDAFSFFVQRRYLLDISDM